MSAKYGPSRSPVRNVAPFGTFETPFAAIASSPRPSTTIPSAVNHSANAGDAFFFADDTTTQSSPLPCMSCPLAEILVPFARTPVAFALPFAAMVTVRDDHPPLSFHATG